MCYNRDMELGTTFTVVLEKGETFWISYCPEIPGANGQGKTKEEAIEDLKEAVLLILQDRREEGMRGVPPDAICERLSLA